jgi:hypothetical protein
LINAEKMKRLLKGKNSDPQAESALAERYATLYVEALPLGMDQHSRNLFNFDTNLRLP